MKTALLLLGLLPIAAAHADETLLREFPLEAARVLAWRVNEGGVKVAEVKVAEVKAEGQSIRWLDATGKVVREKTFTIPEGKDGAAACREIFKQLAGDDWRPLSMPPDNAPSAFWQGAELAGGSRYEALSAAAKLLAEKKVAKPADAARLAGTLAHGALPSLAASTPLDSALVARAAAWLCVSEGMAREPLGAPWVPVLFLGGREEDARLLSASLPKKPANKRSAGDRFWQLVLGKPSAKDCFLFAARSENKSFAAPALALPLAGDAAWSQAALTLAPQILGPDFATRYLDYGSTVGGEWAAKTAAASQEAWSRAVKGLPTLPGDMSADAALAAKSADAARGPAIPVAIATVRDLVRHHFETPVRRVREDGEKAADIDAVVQLALEERKKPSEDAPAPTIDLTKFKTADEFWAGIEPLRTDFKPQGSSPEDQMRIFRSWMTQRAAALAAFAKIYPDDPRRPEARVLLAEAQMQGMNASGAQPPTSEEMDEIIRTPGVSQDVQGEASFVRILLEAQKLNFLERHEFPAFQKLLTEFIDTYPKHRQIGQVVQMQFELLQSIETPAADTILKKLAANPEQQIAAPAKAILAEREQFIELKKKPIDLKFTASDGSAVDLAELRGKVVLIDFWASWCGPCMAEAPHVVEAYRKLHERGFEILGINLDDNRKAMEGAMEKTGMTWKQHHDGKGWKNEIAQRFGIHSIPAAWLFDKQGKLREVGLRGEELQNGIERLLKEP